VEVDSRRIEQVIRNLIQNGIQAMPAGGSLTIETGAQDDFARLHVSDRGSGFSDQALRRFGEPFFSEKEGGMGIGLTLSKEVAEGHQGAVTASNHKDNSGATVILTIPRSNR
jgi:signal transduction histidine kinase